MCYLTDVEYIFVASFKLLEAMNEATFGVRNELGHIKWHK